MVNLRKKKNRTKTARVLEFFGPRDWFRNSLIINEIKKRKRSGKVLDFGCGSGNLLTRLVKEGFSCLGVDESESVLDLVRRKLVAWIALGSVQAKKGDEKTLWRLKEKFDIVVAGEVLEHLADDQMAVCGFGQILKKGGICLVTVPAHMRLWDINDKYSGHYRRYEMGELKKLFESQGFKVEKISYWGFPFTLVWHKLFFLPVIRKYSKAGYSLGPGGIVKKLSDSYSLQEIISFIFRIDNLFNWTNLGGGLILVAKKR